MRYINLLTYLLTKGVGGEIAQFVTTFGSTLFCLLMCLCRPSLRIAPWPYAA